MASSCVTCPAQFDNPDATTCGPACSGNYAGLFCERCKGKYTLVSGCATCPPKYDNGDGLCSGPGTDDSAGAGCSGNLAGLLCTKCKNHFSGTNCELCDDNWDIDQACNVCKSPFVPRANGKCEEKSFSSADGEDLQAGSTTSGLLTVIIAVLISLAYTTILAGLGLFFFLKFRKGGKVETNSADRVLEDLQKEDEIALKEIPVAIAEEKKKSAGDEGKQDTDSDYAKVDDDAV